MKLLWAKTVANLNNNNPSHLLTTAKHSVIVSKIENELAISLARPILVKSSFSNSRVTHFQQTADQVEFWSDTENKAKFPILSKLALTLAAIQATSTESERLFTAAGWHVDGKKNRLEKEQLLA